LIEHRSQDEHAELGQGAIGKIAATIEVVPAVWSAAASAAK